MFNLVCVFVLSILSLSLSEKVDFSVEIEKPNPCYVVDRYEIKDKILKVYLRIKNKNVLCPQVIVKEKLTLNTDKAFEFVEIYTGNKVWKRYKYSKD